jgi:hypothetical protein
MLGSDLGSTPKDRDGLLVSAALDESGLDDDAVEAVRNGNAEQVFRLAVPRSDQPASM